MTPVINPWFFYWAEAISTLKTIAIISIFFLFAFACIWWGFCFLEDKEIENKNKIDKGIIIAFIITVIMNIFIPTNDTIVKMLIAQNVTYERVEIATDTVQTVYEDIMTLFKEGEK